MAAGSNSIVEDWLRSVGLVQYTQAFLDNGYDDLEVCKQIGEDDLAAIGVPGGEHRDQLLGAVKVLREEGGAAVYFTLEECCDTCQSEDDEEDELRVVPGIGDRSGIERRSAGAGGGAGAGGNRHANIGDSRRPSAPAASGAVPAGNSGMSNGSTGGKPGDARSPRPTKPTSATAGGGRKFSGSPATAPPTPSGRGASGGAGVASASLMRMDAYELGKSALVKFPSVQLKLILRDKLVENNIDLSGPPYTNSEMQACGSSLTALAIRFAEELRTHFVDVMERLEELWTIARNNEAMYTQSLCGNSPTRMPYGGAGAGAGSQSMHYGYPGGPGPGQQPFYPPLHPPHLHPGHPHLHHSHPGSPRNQPPPLPSCPPPPTMSGTYMARCPSLQSHLDGAHVRTDQFGQQTYVTMDGGVCCMFPRKIVKDPSGGEDKKKSGSVLGRFLRNIPFRRSNRKGTYKQHQGDLNAYEISMSDEDRVALMVLVKEGKISTQTALAVVQKFEEEKKKTVGGPVDDSKENETPSKKSGKKKKGSKPPKSQSTFSADDPHGASLDPQRALGPGSPPCEHQLYRQRRVHSLGQLDLQAQGQSQGQGQMTAQQQRDLHLERIGLTRAISCTTACGPPGYQFNLIQSDPSKPLRFHSPGHHHYPHPQLQHQSSLQHHHQYPHPHHHHTFNKVDSLRERLTAKMPNAVPKTSSKTSLISSGSDQSMECSGMMGHSGLMSPQGQHTATPMPLRSLDPLLAARLGDGNSANNSNSTVSMSSDNSPATSRKKSVQDPRIKNHRSASCSTGDDGISSDDNENGSRKLQTFGGSKVKSGLDSKRGLKPRDTKISRPPLLKQQSAPVSSMPGNKGSYLGQAKSLVDYSPGPNDVDFVSLKKGEIISIMNLAESGVWWGTVSGRQGKVRFEHVEVVIDPDKTTAAGDKDAATKSVSDLLHKIGLGHLTGLFMLNGYDDLDIFSELDDHDLTSLHITDPGQRSKLLSAARVLGDWHDKSGPEPSNLISAMDSPSSRAGNSSCDSGCYAGSDGLKQHPSATGTPTNSRQGPAQGPPSHHQHHGPCKACGKPKQQSRKLSAPAATGNPQFTSSMVPISPSALAGLPYYPTGQYPTMGAHGNPPHRGQRHVGYSPYVPGQYPGQPYYPSNQQIGYPVSAGGGVYPYGSPHGQQFKHGQGFMPASRTLTDMSVTAESANSSSSATTPTQGGASAAITNNSSSANKPGSAKPPSSSSGPGDRASLTEEDKEIIAITYGKSTASASARLATPLKSSSSMSQPVYQPDQSGPGALASSNITICTMCVPGTSPGYSSHYAPRVDGISMFDNHSNSSSMSSLTYSCAQCAAAYASCPECFPPPSHHYYYNTSSPSSVSNYYRHYYVNTSGGGVPGNSMSINTLSSNGSSTTGTMVNNSGVGVGGVGSVRSDSKSSKMSLSSTCTQTTCLSPDHDDSASTPVGTGGVSTFIGTGPLIEPSLSSNQKPTGHYAPGSGHYGPATQQPLILHPGYAPGPGRAANPLNRGTPILNQTPPTHQQAAPTLALSDPGSGGSMGLLTLQGQPPASSSPAPPQEQAPPPPEWMGQSDGSVEGPGMARLYTRGKSQTPDGSDKSVEGDGSGSTSSKENKVKSPTRSLMPLVSTKLSAERIDLTEVPYSSVMGHCGIPPLLVQRYSEELRQETDVMALVLEQLRERQLRALGRPCIQNEQLSQSCRTACDLQISSVQDFLISIGLPMYFGPLTTSAAAPPTKASTNNTGSNKAVSSPSPVRSMSKQTSQAVTLEKLLAMSEAELEQATGADARHLRRIVHALGWVQLKLGGTGGAQGACSNGAAEQGEATGKTAAGSGKPKAGTVTDKV